MAKRFLDTGFLNQKWIRKLAPEYKAFLIYLMLKCDNAGIIELDLEDAEFWIGKKIDKFTQHLPNGYLTRVQDVPGEKYFMPKFLTWQYPNFPHSNVHQQKQAIQILTSLNIFDIQTNSFYKNYLTLTQPLPKSQVIANGNGNGNVKEGCGGENCLMKNSGVTVSQVKESFERTIDLKRADPLHYYNTAMDWSEGKGMMRKDWVATVRNIARGDIKDGKLKLSNNASASHDRVKSEKLPDNYGMPRGGAPMPESLKNLIKS